MLVDTKMMVWHDRKLENMVSDTKSNKKGENMKHAKTLSLGAKLFKKVKGATLELLCKPSFWK